jgi:hypothetical protein
MESSEHRYDYLRFSLHHSEWGNRLSCMKTPQDLNPLDALRQLQQNGHRNRKDRLSNFLVSLWRARDAKPAGRDHLGGDLPEEEFMARFAQELARWPCGSDKLSKPPASRLPLTPELMNAGYHATVQGLDCAGVCRPPEDLLDGYLQWLAPSIGDVAFVIGEGTNPNDLDLCVNSLIGHYFRVAGGGELLKPKRIACDLNDLVFDSRDRKTVSCFYAHYTAATRVLRYFNAGHRSPLLLRSNPDHAIRLNKGGQPLGSAQTQSYSEGLLQLKSGDRMIAFTTGVAESWVTPNDSSGEIALLNIMRGWAEESATEIANLIIAEGTSAIRPRQLDRIAVVASVKSTYAPAHGVCLNKELLVANTA